MDAEKHLTLPEHLSVMDTDYLFVMHRFCLSAAMVADDRFGDRIAITLVSKQRPGFAFLLLCESIHNLGISVHIKADEGRWRC